jgi:hypothetical protein
LSKIDEVAVEKYLCALYDLNDPKENIARIIVDWINKKGRMKIEKPKEDKTKEESDNDFKMIMDGSKSYISGIKQQGSS